MSPRLTIFLIAASALALPAFAQSISSNPAADAAEQPVTQSLNNSVAGQAAATDAANNAMQNQYELDRAAFRAEVATRHAKIVDDQMAYARQQAAYADAMAAWRRQSDACKAGSMAACKARTPVPADFYTP